MQGAPNKSSDRNAASPFFTLIVEIDDVVNRGTRSNFESREFRGLARGAVGRFDFSLKEALKMAVQWNKDVDAALTQAKADKKPLLLDFSAAPA